MKAKDIPTDIESQEESIKFGQSDHTRASQRMRDMLRTTRSLIVVPIGADPERDRAVRQNWQALNCF